MTSDNRKSTERAASKLFKFCFLKRIANEAALWNSNRPNSIWASQYEHLNLRFSNEISVEIPNFNQNFIKNFSARLPIYIDKLKNHNISSYRTQKSYHLSPFQTNSIIEEVSAKPANFFYFLLRSNWRVHSSNCPVNFIPLHWHLRFDISHLILSKASIQGVWVASNSKFGIVWSFKEQVQRNGWLAKMLQMPKNCSATIR